MRHPSRHLALSSLPFMLVATFLLAACASAGNGARPIATAGLPTPTAGSGTAVVFPAAAVVPSPMNVGRQGSTATLLLDGRVLVAGGTSPTGEFLASSELYDPSTGHWSMPGNMTSARTGHAAALLADGRVLVTGGRDSGGCALPPALNTAELFDPSTGSWTKTSPMIARRIDHQAVTLDDGRVLAVGGVGFAGPSNDNVPYAELFDPRTGTWSRSSDPRSRPDTSALTRLKDGRVLLVGSSRGQQGASAAIFDPKTNAWQTTGVPLDQLSNPRLLPLPSGHALELDGTSVGLYDPAAGRWSRTSPMTSPRTGAAVALLNDGRVLLAGGRTIDSPLNRPVVSGLFYDANADRWSPAPELSKPRAESLATVLKDGRVLLTDGDTARTDIFDPSTNTWRSSDERLEGEPSGCGPRPRPSVTPSPTPAR